VRLPLERFLGSARTARVGRFPSASALLSGLSANARARVRPRLGTDARSTRLGKTDGDGLFGIPCAVLSLANVVHLFANELTRLSGRTLSLRAVASGSLQGLFAWHSRGLATSLPRRSLIPGSPCPEEAPRRSPPPTRHRLTFPRRIAHDDDDDHEQPLPSSN